MGKTAQKKKEFSYFSYSTHMEIILNKYSTTTKKSVQSDTCDHIFHWVPNNDCSSKLRLGARCEHTPTCHLHFPIAHIQFSAENEQYNMVRCSIIYALFY